MATTITNGYTRINGMCMKWASGITLPAVPDNGDDTDRVAFIVRCETRVGDHYGVDPSQWHNCMVTAWDVEQATATAITESVGDEPRYGIYDNHAQMYDLVGLYPAHAAERCAAMNAEFDAIVSPTEKWQMIGDADARYEVRNDRDPAYPDWLVEYQEQGRMIAAEKMRNAIRHAHRRRDLARLSDAQLMRRYAAVGQAPRDVAQAMAWFAAASDMDNDAWSTRPFRDHVVRDCAYRELYPAIAADEDAQFEYGFEMAKEASLGEW